MIVYRIQGENSTLMYSSTNKAAAGNARCAQEKIAHGTQFDKTFTTFQDHRIIGH
jgi:hypothetical protein